MHLPRHFGCGLVLLLMMPFLVSRCEQNCWEDLLDQPELGMPGRPDYILALCCPRLPACVRVGCSAARTRKVTVGCISVCVSFKERVPCKPPPLPRRAKVWKRTGHAYLISERWGVENGFGQGAVLSGFVFHAPMS